MNIVIAGVSGGIGDGFVEKLDGRPNVETILATYHRSSPAVSFYFTRNPSGSERIPEMFTLFFDEVTDSF